MLEKLSVKLVFGICAALLVIVALFSYQQYRLHEFELLNSLKDSLTRQGTLVAKAVEFGMLEEHPSITQEMVEELARDPDVETVWILDKRGTVKASSERAFVGNRLRVEEQTCQICHDKSLEERSRTIIYTGKNGRKLFRNVIAIKNEEKCHSCHSPASKVNGVLIIDYALANIHEQLRADLGRMSTLALLMLAVIAGVVVLLTNRMILAKVKKLERVSKRVQEGDLDARVAVHGHDEISFLARHFNQMTSSLQASIKQSEEQKRYLEKLINSIDDAVVVMDRNCRLVMANRSYMTRFGPAAGNPGEEGCFALAHRSVRPCEGASFDCPARESFEQGLMSKTVYCFEGDDGSRQFWEIHASPVKGEEGEVTEVVEVIRDITERKILEQKLSHSERLASLGIMASGICHELNNPLASVTACLDGLQRRVKRETASGDGHSEVLAEYIGLIQGEIARCKDLTGKLLTLSEKPKASLDRLDLHKVLNETLALFKEQLDARRIGMTTDLSPDLRTLLADEGQIRQIFHNLILNAMEAVSEGGEIHISTRVKSDRVIVAIRDTGRGIKAEDLPRVFEPFFTKTVRKRGTGLGLTICESIVRQHEGDIRIESDYGRGTTVTIVLPLDAQTFRQPHRSPRGARG